VDNLGTAWEHQRAGRFLEAEACYRRFLATDPSHAEGWAALGGLAFRRQDLDEAIRCYLRSLALKPGAGDVLASLGAAYALKRDFVAAEQTLRQATAVRPQFLEAYRNLGHALRDQGKYAAAAEAYQRASRLRPDDFNILSNLGIALRKANRAVDAVESLAAAARLAPREIELHQLLGYSLAEAGRFDEAEAAFRHALELDPKEATSYSGLGFVLLGAKRFAEAEASCRVAIRLNPQLVGGHQNLGNTFLDLDRHDEALDCYATALAISQDLPDVHNNVGIALGRTDRLEDAVRAYDRAIALNPNHLDARKNRAIMRLSLGNYVEGFAEFESRLAFNDAVRVDFTQPVWKGEPIAGKTILMVAEQGFGDNIQFIRFAPKVKALGATVIFRCFKPLMRLLANFPGVDVLIPEGDPLPPFDVHVPLASLADVFRTRLEDVTGILRVPYLHPDHQLVEHWKARLGLRAPGELRVGICWQGNPTHLGDRFRSVPLEAFVPLAAVPGVRLISLQKNHGLEQIAPLADRLSLLDLHDSTRFEDSAAVMSLLDLVITIDSAPVHLAGALGIPTWLALSTAPEWRWLAGREESPWYPSVRIFRQSQPDDWDDVFRRMARALADLAASPGRGTMAEPISVQMETAS
jgi:tetratricopeptide (TPR) repeat protein